MRGGDLAPRSDGAPGSRIAGPEVPALLVNEYAARALGVEPGSTVTVRASCARDPRESLPPVTFVVAGVADFPFDDVETPQAATSARDLAQACGESEARAANMILVTSADDRSDGRHR